MKYKAVSNKKSNVNYKKIKLRIKNLKENIAF